MNKTSFVALCCIVLSAFLLQTMPAMAGKKKAKPAPAKVQAPVISDKVECTGSCWKPPLKTRWNYVLSEAVDLSIVADAYDIDLFETPVSDIKAIHEAKRKAVCYFSAGSSEDWRPDFNKFPKSVMGKALDGWPGEKWLDVRNIAALGPIMTARMDQCKAKGFDSVEFDNVDGYSNASGFPLTSDDQLKYNKFLANEAHKRGLSAGLKNDLDQVTALVNYYDYAVNEQCFQYKECTLLLPFIQAGKPVFNVEYSGNKTAIFKQANELNFNTVLKSLELKNSAVFSR